MYLSRKLAVFLLFVCLCACVYDSVQGKKDDLDSVLKSYSQLAKRAGKDPSFINPFRLLLRILLTVTFPARFVLRFITTIIAVVSLTLAGCDIFPEASCGTQDMLGLIPQILTDLKTDMEFYIGLAQDIQQSN